jgi:hypothetical protein
LPVPQTNNKEQPSSRSIFSLYTIFNRTLSYFPYTRIFALLGLSRIFLLSVFSHCTLSLIELNHIFLISPHTSENRVGIFPDRNGTVEVFIKTEEDDENGDSLEQHPLLTPVETPCAQPLNPER